MRARPTCRSPGSIRPRFPEWPAGTEVAVRGVVKRRFYRGAAGTQSRTEVVADEICQLSKRRVAQRLLERAVTALGA